MRVLCTRLLAGIPLGDGDGEESKLLHRFHCFADVMRWALLPSPSNNECAGGGCSLLRNAGELCGDVLAH